MVLFNVPWAWCDFDGIKPEILLWFAINPIEYQIMATDWDFIIEFKDHNDLLKFKLAQTLSSSEPEDLTRTKQLTRLLSIELQREIDKDIIAQIATDPSIVESILKNHDKN